jgi:adenine phosphoribosyltransferase
VKLSDALSLIREIPNFPKPGILFQDITPLLSNASAFKSIIDHMYAGEYNPDYVAGMEARGFIFASALANEHNIGFIPIRKSGKLPAETYQESYGLEYGSDCLEIHKDSCKPGSNILIVDDVLATGGTACAAIKLVHRSGGTVSRIVFLLELESLQGRKKIEAEFPSIEIQSLKII